MLHALRNARAARRICACVSWTRRKNNRGRGSLDPRPLVQSGRAQAQLRRARSYERSPFVQSPFVTGSPPLPKDLLSRRLLCTRQAAKPLPAGRHPRHIARGEKDTPSVVAFASGRWRVWNASASVASRDAVIIAMIARRCKSDCKDHRIRGTRRSDTGRVCGVGTEGASRSERKSSQGSKSSKAPFDDCSSRYFCSSATL